MLINERNPPSRKHTNGQDFPGHVHGQGPVPGDTEHPGLYGRPTGEQIWVGMGPMWEDGDNDDDHHLYSKKKKTL